MVLAVVVKAEASKDGVTQRFLVDILEAEKESLFSSYL